jgi:hypothetical protein
MGSKGLIARNLQGKSNCYAAFVGEQITRYGTAMNWINTKCGIDTPKNQEDVCLPGFPARSSCGVRQPSEPALVCPAIIPKPFSVVDPQQQA